MTKKNWMVFPVILMILTGLVFVTVFSCGSKDPEPEIYTGSDTDGKAYELTITGGTYGLKIDGKSVSTGTVKKDGDTFTLTPNGGGDPFKVTVAGTKIKGIVGAITPDDGSEAIEPGQIVQGESTAGAWDWSLSDDSGTNEYLDVQTIFAPGGASRFENAQTNPADVDDKGKPIKRPYVYPAGTVNDINGDPINEPVYNFKGNTKVSSENRTANVGARFPLLGWEAVPDETTLAALKTAYSYSFWVKLNSSTNSKWAFLTAVFTDFPAEKGYEYGHWFGNTKGDSGAKNITNNLRLGEWVKITVILKPTDKGGNIDQAAWIHSYNPEYEGEFKQDKIQKLQWQVPLQHNGGTARGGDPYDIIKGSYDFDLDFYGLTLNMD
jgi:hypothetical protein